jgi:hypothetical protein
MTDGFKGYVTKTGLSPNDQKNLVDLFGIAPEKILLRGCGWFPVSPYFFSRIVASHVIADHAAWADFRNSAAAIFRSLTKCSYSRALASASGSRSVTKRRRSRSGRLFHQKRPEFSTLSTL